MDSTYWQKQTKQLFPELEWNKPERRDQAGRLLIVGGNVHNLNAPARAYEITRKTGIGEARVILPDSTKKLVVSFFPEAILLPSTNSGEFSLESGPSLLEYSQWSDTVLLPGNVGRNSQTSIVIEELLRSFKGSVVLACDALDSVINSAEYLLKREQTVIIASFAQLQKLISNSGSANHIFYGMDLVKLVELLHTLSQKWNCSIITLHQNQIITAHSGKISTTKIEGEEPKIWRVRAASLAACYITWNPNSPHQAITHVASLI